MEYLPPFVIFGTHSLKDADIGAHADEYEALMQYVCKTDLNALRTEHGLINGKIPLSTGDGR